MFFSCCNTPYLACMQNLSGENDPTRTGFTGNPPYSAVFAGLYGHSIRPGVTVNSAESDSAR